MILTAAQIHSIMHEKARELRFPFTGETFPEEGEGETCPVRSKQGRVPACWILIVASSIDDEREEYVYEFQRVAAPDTPRLLAPTGTAGDGFGYTSNPHLAMRDEPEAVPASLTEHYAFVGGMRHLKTTKAKIARAQRDRELLTVEERLVRAREAALSNYVHIHDEVKALKRMQAHGKPGVAAQLKRIEEIAHREAA